MHSSYGSIASIDSRSRSISACASSGNNGRQSRMALVYATDDHESCGIASSKHSS